MTNAALQINMQIELKFSACYRSLRDAATATELTRVFFAWQIGHDGIDLLIININLNFIWFCLNLVLIW